ncbi:MAG TPA: NAD(P)-dependent oxidoreductase [Rhizomicrobium sp.]|nr:NAD(P)-dependent oxidoreductase [Rhizomicrobium sp.]
MKVGCIGLGQMGSGMAESLLRAGHEVTVYNRTRAKADALVATGAKFAGTVADACRGDAVLTMLANDDAVEAVVYGDQGVLASLAKGAVHVSSSTISPKLSERLAADHSAAGQRLVAAPVFGRPNVAAAGKLSVVAAGDANSVRSVAPLFDAIGQKTFIISETPKDANIVKLSGNFLIATVIESLAEAIALIAKAGIDKRQYLDILTSTLFDCPVYRTYGDLVVRGAYEPPGFAASLAHKDIRLALAAAEDLRVPMPFASVVHDRFLALLANGGERLDSSAIARLVMHDAGLH